MKRILFVSALVVSLLLIVALGVSAQTAPTPEPPAPVDIVTAYYDAINTGDLATALTYLDEDVLFVNPIGRFEGLEAATQNLEEIIASHLTFELGDLEETGGRVVYSYEVFIDGESVEVGDGGLTIVSDGLITFDGTVPLQAIDVVSSFYNAFNEGDLEAALTYISENAEFINPTGSYSGIDEISEQLAGLIAEDFRFDLSDFVYEADGGVHYTYTVYSGDTRLDAGTDGLTIVTDGWITFDGTETTASANES